MSSPTTIEAAPGVSYMDIVREFDAPVAAVFRAHIDPTLLEQWLGPRTATIEVIEYDATRGGRWEYRGRSGGGHEFAFWGVFHTVEPDALTIQTFEFDGAPGLVGITSARFEQLDGRCRLSIHEVYPTVEARDLALATGMEHGIVEGYERLEALLA